MSNKKTVEDAYKFYNGYISKEIGDHIFSSVQSGKFAVMRYSFVNNQDALHHWIPVCTRQEFEDYAKMMELNKLNNKEQSDEPTISYISTEEYRDFNFDADAFNVEFAKNRVENNIQFTGVKEAVKELSEHNKEVSAIKTLESMGYSHNGGVMWKPPLGERKSKEAVDIEAHKDNTKQLLKLNKFLQKTSIGSIGDSVVDVAINEISKHICKSTQPSTARGASHNEDLPPVGSIVSFTDESSGSYVECEILMYHKMSVFIYVDGWLETAGEFIVKEIINKLK